MNTTPDAHGEHQPEPAPPGPKTVLIFAGACGAVAGHFAHDWRTGIEVFSVIVALFTRITADRSDTGTR